MKDIETIFVKAKDGKVCTSFQACYYCGPKTSNMWFKILEDKHTDYGLGYILVVPTPVPQGIQIKEK